MKQSDSLGIFEQGRFEYAMNRRLTHGPPEQVSWSDSDSSATSPAAAAADSADADVGKRLLGLKRAELMPSPPVEVTLEYVNSPRQGDELIVDVWETDPLDGGLLFHLRSALNPRRIYSRCTMHWLDQQQARDVQQGGEDESEELAAQSKL